MQIRLITLIFLLITGNAFSQQTDTLTFFSKAFGQECSVVIHLPEFYEYKADTVQLPVVYVLDGQHEWFVDPLLTTLHYLQYTHQIPSVLTVVIPHNNRNQECAVPSLEESLPLDRFITEDLEGQLAAYRPNPYRILIGHSLSALFALYSAQRNPDFYTAVLSCTPPGEFEDLIPRFTTAERYNLDRIYLAIGGLGKEKDYYHRRVYDELKQRYPSFFSAIHTFEADFAAHNAVPIVAIPAFLTELFSDFSSRYIKIAEVDMEYKLVQMPTSIEAELASIRQASRLGDYYYAPQLSDINGLASRYYASGLMDYSAAIYELGIKYFPKYFEFYLSLYDSYLDTDIDRAKFCLLKAEELLRLLEMGHTDTQEILDAVLEERAAQGW
ncbi:MAG: hypothetical protein GC205_11375 [Bacteroidetes bacterium]|nr:hypothetical protein [Bacteroidota bacterium]